MDIRGSVALVTGAAERATPDERETALRTATRPEDVAAQVAALLRG